MANYALNLIFSGKDLDIIDRCRQKVVIAKQSTNGSKTAWITFDPFEYNSVEWTEQYALYASTSEVKKGATIRKMSDCTALQQVNSVFERGWFAEFQPQPLPNNTFKITHKNADSGVLTFGLAQNVIVNGSMFDNHPINAVPVAYGHSATMSPIERIDVYLAANLDTAMVLTEVDSPVISLAYSGDTTEFSIEYNSDTGMFLPRIN
jgi:hypothetical protein